MSAPQVQSKNINKVNNVENNMAINYDPNTVTNSCSSLAVFCLIVLIVGEIINNNFQFSVKHKTQQL